MVAYRTKKRKIEYCVDLHNPISLTVFYIIYPFYSIDPKAEKPDFFYVMRESEIDR